MSNQSKEIHTPVLDPITGEPLNVMHLTDAEAYFIDQFRYRQQHDPKITQLESDDANIVVAYKRHRFDNSSLHRQYALAELMHDIAAAIVQNGATFSVASMEAVWEAYAVENHILRNEIKI